MLLACNLSSPPPPTLMPRATATPLPTIGYATLSPDELPVQATALPPSNAVLLSLLNQVSAEGLMSHVQTLQSLETRHVNSGYTRPGAGVNAARDYISAYFRELEAQSQGRFRVIPHSFNVEWGDVSSTAENVVGYLAGRETGAGVILIGAHYDTISYAIEDGSAYAPGANDNGSGIAALMEVARIMALDPQPPRATVLFAAFSAEEIGREGSKAFINDYIRAYDLPLLAMINLDIVGSSTGADGSINDRVLRVYSEGPNEPASQSRQLARELNLVVSNYMPDFQLEIQDATDREGRFGDHMSFSEVGYPAVRFIEPLEEFNRQHTPNDTLDDVQPNYLSRATQAVLVAAKVLADGPRAPRNVVVRDNGSGERSLVWEPAPEAVSYVVALRYPGSLQYNQYFETSDTNIASEIFRASLLASVAIAGRDEDGLLGPLSIEYTLTN